MTLRNPEEIINEMEPTLDEQNVVAPKPVNGIPQEVIDFANDLKLNDDIINEPTTGDMIKGYGGGAAVEMGLGIGGSIATSKNAAYSRHLKNLINTTKTIRYTGRAIGANPATKVTPLTALGSFGVFVATEGATWGLANIAGQQMRKAYGLQEDIQGGELLGATLFGIVAKPVEGLKVFDDMGKALNKKLPIKFKQGDLLDMKAWKGREVIVKGAPRYVSGSALGLAESSFRQEMAILLGEQENRNTWDYLFSAGFGGTINSAFHVFNRTGAWGRQQASTLSDRAKNRTLEALETINEQLKTATKGKKRQLLKQRNDHETALALIEDFSDTIDAQIKRTDIKEPVPSVPKNEELSYKELQAKAKEAKIPANQKKQVLIDKLNTLETTPVKPPAPTIERAISREDAFKQADELQNEFLNLKGEEDFLTLSRPVHLKSARLYDKIDYDSNNAIVRLDKDANDIEAIDMLIDTAEAKIKLKDGVLGELNKFAGDGVRLNRKDVNTIDLERLSLANEFEIAAQKRLIVNLKKRKAFIKNNNADDLSVEDITNPELYKSVYEAAYGEAHSHIAAGWKYANAFRVSRKLGMVNSLGSAQAVLPTGAFEMGKLFIKPLATRILHLKQPMGRRLAAQEWYGNLEAFNFLMFGEKGKTSRQQLFKHMGRTFREAKDPNKASVTRMDEETKISSFIKSGVEQRIYKQFINDPEISKTGQSTLLRWAGKNAVLGALIKFQTLGGRAIMAGDAGFKRQLRIAAARTKARQQGILAHPNDEKAAMKYADELYNTWTKDRDGLQILDAEGDLQAEFNEIDTALLMTATSDDILGIQKNLMERTLVQPIARLLNAPSGVENIYGGLIEAAMPFYVVSMRSMIRMGNVANPLSTLRLAVNPYKTKIGELKYKASKAQKELELAIKNGDTDAEKRFARQVETHNEYIKMVELRKMAYNKEVLTDTIAGSGLFLTGFALGASGQATGTGLWMSSDMRQNNEFKSFQLFGRDYRAGVPFVLSVAIAADLGAYWTMRRREKETKEKLLPKGITPAAVMYKTVLGAAQELPTNEVFQEFSKFGRSPVEDLGNQLSDSLSKTLGTYGQAVVPAQIRKVVNKAFHGEDLSELRGASFSDRILYYSLGVPTPTPKIDEFGEHEISTKGWEFTVDRFAVEKNRREIDPSKYREIKASDHFGILPQNVISQFMGINANYIVDEEGVSFKYRFGQRLKRTKIEGKTLKQTVNKYIRSSEFRKLQTEEEILSDGTARNLGLVELSRIFNKFYKQTKDEIVGTDTIKMDKIFLNKFVTNTDENLLRVVENHKKVERVVRPKPALEIQEFTNTYK